MKLMNHVFLEVHPFEKIITLSHGRSFARKSKTKLLLRIPDFMIACNQIHSQQILSSICRIMKHTTKALMMNRLIQSSRLITNVRERNAIYPDLKES